MSQNKNLRYYFFASRNKALSFENLITVAAFVYPITGVPQLIEVAKGNTEGVSALSWAGFAFFVALFLIYSIKHKITPMIITYAMWLTVDLAIVIGVLLNS